MPRLSDTCY